MSLEELSGSDKTNTQPPASTDDSDKKHWLEFPGVSVAPSETQPAPAVDPYAAFRLGSSPTLSRTSNDTTIPTLPGSQPAAGPLLGTGGAFNFGNLSVDKSKDFSGNTGTNRVIEVQGQDGNSARFLVTQAQKSGPVLDSDSVGYTPLDAYGRQLRGTTFMTGLTEMRPEVRKAIEAQSFVAPQRTLGADIASKTGLNSANYTQFPDQPPQPQQRIADLIAPAGQPTVAEKTWMSATSSADLVGPTETRPVTEPIVKAVTTGNADPVLPSSLSSADQPVALRSAPSTVPIATTAGVAAANLADKALGSDAAPAVVDTSNGIRRTAGVVSDDTTAVGANRITGDTVGAGQRPASLSVSKPLTALSGDANAPLLNDAASAARTLFAATTTVLSPGNLGLLPTSRDVAPSVTGQGSAAQVLGSATRPFQEQKAVSTGNSVTTAISDAIVLPPGSTDRLSPYRGVEVAATVTERGMVYEARRLAANNGQNVIVVPPKDTTLPVTEVNVTGRPIVTREGLPVAAYTTALSDQARGYSQPAAGALNLGDAAVARNPEARAAFSTGTGVKGDNVGGIATTATAAITKSISNNDNSQYIGRPKQPTDGKGTDTTAGGIPIPTIRDSQNALRQPSVSPTTSKDILPSSKVVDPKAPVLPSQITKPDQVTKPAVVIPSQGKLMSEAIAAATSTRSAAADLSRGIIRQPDDSKVGTPAKLPPGQKPEVRTEAGPTAMAAKAALDKGATAITVTGKPTERTAVSVNPGATTRVEASRTAVVANKGELIPTRARLDSGKEAKPGSDSQHMLATKPAVKPNEIATASTRLLGTTSTKLPPEKVTGNGTLGVVPTRSTRAADIAAVKPGKGDAVKVEVVKAGDAKTSGIKVAGASDKPVITISRTLGGEKGAGEGKTGGTKLVGPDAKIAAGKTPAVGATDKGIAAATKGGAVTDKGTAAATKGGAVTDKGVAEKGSDRSIGGRLVGSKSANGVSTLVEGRTITGTRPAASRLGEKTDVKIDSKAIANATRTIGGKGVAADTAKFVVGDKKTEGKSVSSIKIGSGKLNVADADVKAIIGSRFGTSKLVTTDKIDIKAISGARVGVTGKLTLNESDIKALVGGRFGVKIAGAVKGMPVATAADAKVSPAHTAKSSGKVVISDAAVKAITSPKSIASAKQLSGEKADAKAIPTTGKANKAIATGDTSGKPVSKAELIAGPGGVKGAKTSVGNNVIAEKSNLVKTQPNCLVKAGTDRVDTSAPKAARPLDAVAKIFGMALGTDKADKNSLRDSKTEGKDKAVRTDEQVARRIVGNGIQSTESKNGQHTDGNREDVDKIKKDAKNNDRVAGSTTRNNQQVSDKLQNWMMQIAEAGLNFGDRRAAKVSQSQKSQNLFKAAGRRRRRYTVRYGDNIRSIARVQLGDERFAQLIITINRGSAGFYMLPDNKTPHLLVDQVIWLPSDAELDIHKKHFFARGTAAGEQQSAPAISVAPEAITVPQVEMEKVTLPEVEIMQGDNTEASAPPTTVSYEQNQQEVASFLQRLRSAGHRQAVSLQNFEEGGQFDTTEPPQQGDRRVYRVRLGDTLRSIALRDSLMQDQTMWPLLARVNGLSEQRDATTGHPTASLSRGETVTLPTEEEIKQYRLMNRLASAANNATLCTAETNLLPTESQSNEPKPFIETLSQSCRINSIESESHDAYMTRLEMYINGQWMTVATYDYRHGHAYRYIHRKNGSVAAFPMDLPLEVVRQMSHEDFARNWTTYCIDFATVSPDAVSRSS